MKNMYLSVLLALPALNGYGQYGQISNGGFESWENVVLYDTPDYWLSSNTEEFYGTPAVEQSSDSQEGAYSAKLSSILLGQDTVSGYVFHGSMGVSGPDGGIPYTDNFEAVTFYYKANLAAGDTLYLYMIRYNAGTIVDFDVIPAAYGTVNSWTPNLLYVGNIVQDELFIGFSLGDPNGGSANTPGAWAMVDNVQLIAGGVTTTPLPNYGFETWTTETYEEAVDWNSINSFLWAFGAENANKTSDANSGAYAIEMTTILLGADSISSFLSLGPINLFSMNPFGQAPYNASPTQFSGAYKFAPANGDFAGIEIDFFQGGTQIGTHFESFSAQSNWTQFTSSLNITGVPDSIFFLVFSGNNVGSVLKLDDLLFTGGNIGLNENALLDFEVYPNPAVDQAVIALPEEGSFTMQILSLDGNILASEENINGNQHINLRDFNKGIYIIRIIDGSIQLTKKLVVE